MTATLIETCPGCHPELLPDGRVGEAHVAVRLGDRLFQVWLDGDEVTNEVNEANVHDGYVVSLVRDAEGKRHLCPAVPRWRQHSDDGSRDHVAMELRRGVVRIRKQHP